MKKFLISTIAATAIAATPAFADHLKIDFDNAKVTGDSITFQSVKSDKDGFVVIHEMRDGAPVVPGHMGYAPINAGDNANVSVPIVGAAAGTEYYAMIHYDTDGDGEYTFADDQANDGPGMKADGTPYGGSFKATGAAQ